MSPTPFWKYHGIGNDFIVLDRRHGGAPLPEATVRRLCHRHRGIGADGILSLWPAALAGVDGTMQVQNADGSEAGMCGNGLRCLARFVYERGHVPESQATLHLGLCGSDLTYRCERVNADRFRVDLPAPEPLPGALPSPAAGRPELTLEIGGREFAGTALSFGNPHVVIFTPEAPLPLAEQYGPSIERHPFFPDRVNASFATERPGGFEAVVFERGVGITQACGSGACAIGAAAVERGLWQTGAPMLVGLPGGELVIEVQDRHVSMEGEALPVFRGEVEL